MDTSGRLEPIPVEPVVYELPAECTPLRALGTVGSRPYTLFLESAGTPGEASEWTLLAFDPLYRLVLRDGRLRRTGRLPDSGSTFAP